MRRLLREQAQVLPLFALLMTGLFGAIGLSVDLGRAYTEKAELSRALDSAALAGAIQLPDTTSATAKATQYMTINMPRATMLAPNIDVPAQKVTISATSRVSTTFLRILGISHIDVSASAQAGASNLGDSALPLDVELVLDDTGSMGSGCTNAQRDTPSANQSSPVCPIGLTRNAAHSFLNILYPASGSPSSTQVGFNSFRGCYNAIPFKDGANKSVSVNRYGLPNLNPLFENGESGAPTLNYHQYRGCVSRNDESQLTSSTSAISAKVDGMRGAGGYPGTNLCLGLFEGWNNLNNPTYRQSNARKILIILTDGDNSYTDGAESASTTSYADPSARVLSAPVPNTYPSGVLDSTGSTPLNPPADPANVNDCKASGSLYDNRIDHVDLLTYNEAQYLKSQNVEIFVVGYGVRGTDDGKACNAASVTNLNGTGRAGNSDNLDRNLNKCIASSKLGTNDHYFETTAVGLPGVFQNIAQQISYRLLK